MRIICIYHASAQGPERLDRNVYTPTFISTLPHTTNSCRVPIAKATKWVCSIRRPEQMVVNNPSTKTPMIANFLLFGIWSLYRKGIRVRKIVLSHRMAVADKLEFTGAFGKHFPGVRGP